MLVVPPKKNIVIAIEGLVASGKSTAGNIMAKQLGGFHFNGDTYMFDFVEKNPQIFEPIFGVSRAEEESGRSYCLKNLKTKEQAKAWFEATREHMDKLAREMIEETHEASCKVAIFDYVTSSNMYPWVGNPDTIKILIKADKRKKAEAFVNRVLKDKKHRRNHFKDIHPVKGQEHIAHAHSQLEEGLVEMVIIIAYTTIMTGLNDTRATSIICVI